MKHPIAAATTALFAGLAHAHEGHGATGDHWHATDAWGFVVIAVVVGGVLWLRGRK